MILIIGGAYQGKLDYVKEKYNINDDEVFECISEAEIDRSKRVFNHFEYYLEYCLNNEKSPILDFDENQIVIMNDIFCGVVPIEKELRALREYCGRAGAELTRRADHVIRIFCGLPQELK